MSFSGGANALHGPYSNTPLQQPSTFSKRVYGDGYGAASTAGPGNALADQDGYGNFGNTEPDWVDFFGPPIKEQAPPFYNQENYDLPDAYEGSNVFMSKVMISVITWDEMYLVREVLPWEVREDMMSLSWDIWQFNDHLVNRQPEESVSRLLTMQKRSGSATMERFGLAMSLEHGFKGTKQGQMNYYKNIQQIKNAFVETMCLGVATALLSAKAPSDTLEQQRGGVNRVGVREFEKNVRFHVERWGLVHKSANGFATLHQWCKDVLSERGHNNSNYTIVPAGLKKYLTFAEQQIGGNKVGAPHGSSLDGGYGTVRESRAFRTGEDRANYDPFFRNRTIGGFFTSNGQATSMIATKDFKTAMRDLLIYCEDDDAIVRLTIDSLLENCGLFVTPEPGSEHLVVGNKNSYALTILGAKYFAGYDSWLQLTDAAKLTENFVRKLQGDTSGYLYRDFLEQFVHVKGSAPTGNGNDGAPVGRSTATALPDLLKSAFTDFKVGRELALLHNAFLQTNLLNDERQALSDLENFTVTGYAKLFALSNALTKNGTATAAADMLAMVKLMANDREGDEYAIQKVGASDNGANLDNIWYAPDHDMTGIAAYRFTTSPSTALGKQVQAYVRGTGDDEWVAWVNRVLLPTTGAAKSADNSMVLYASIQNISDSKPFDALAGQRAPDALDDTAMLGFGSRLLAAIINKGTNTKADVDLGITNAQALTSTVLKPTHWLFSAPMNVPLPAAVASRVTLRHNGGALHLSDHLAVRFRAEPGRLFHHYDHELGPIMLYSRADPAFARAYHDLAVDMLARFGDLHNDARDDVARNKDLMLWWAWMLYLYEHREDNIAGLGVKGKEVSIRMEKLLLGEDEKLAEQVFKIPATIAWNKAFDKPYFSTVKAEVTAHATAIGTALTVPFGTFDKQRDRIHDLTRQRRDRARDALANESDDPALADTDLDPFAPSASGKGHAPADPKTARRQQILWVLKHNRIDDGRLFFWCLRNDVQLPLGFICFTPHQRYSMGSMWHGVSGRNLGSTFVGHVDFQAGDDIVRKMHYCNFTAYGKPLVLYHERCVVVPDVMSSGYLGGHGRKFFPGCDEVVRLDYQSGALDFDIFCCAVPFEWSANRSMIDITGAYNPEKCKDPMAHVPQYPSAAIYAEWWSWAHQPAEPEFDVDYFGQSTQQAAYNTICLQNFQAEFNYTGGGGGEWNNITTNKGHWGENVYEGCGRVRKGLYAMFDPVDYTHLSRIRLVATG